MAATDDNPLGVLDSVDKIYSLLRRIPIPSAVYVPVLDNLCYKRTQRHQELEKIYIKATEARKREREWALENEAWGRRIIVVEITELNR